MTKAATITLTILAMLLIGCGTDNTFSIAPDTPSLASPEGMAQYLRKLPAVKDVQPWKNEYAPGIVITTEHYQIKTTLLEPLMLRQLPGYVESVYKEYQKQVPNTVDSQTKSLVYLFATRDQWEKFTTLFTGRQYEQYLKIQKGGYYLNGACVTYNIGRTRTFAVIGHEGWHQFTSRHYTFRLPSWLDEGIATQFETSKFNGSKFSFHPDKNTGRLAALKITLQNKNMIPLNDLIALNPGQVINHADSATAFYAQSYALVRFLREDKYGKRLRKYHDLMAGAMNGSWPLSEQEKQIAADRRIPITVQWNSYVSPKLFKFYIEEDIARLDQEYKNFCRKIVYHVRLQQK